MLKIRSSAAQRTVLFTLGVFIAIFAVLHITIVLIGGSMGQWFDLDAEFGAASLYSSFLWVCAAFTMLLLSTQTRERLEVLRWWVLGLFFLYIAFDESLVIHERFAEPIRNVLAIPNSSLFYHAWVLVAIGIVVALVGFVSLIRAKTSGSRLQRRIIICFLVLAVGVIALEIIGTRLYFSPMAYRLGPVFVEEIFELIMTSLIVYIATSRLLQLMKPAR